MTSLLFLLMMARSGHGFTSPVWKSRSVLPPDEASILRVSHKKELNVAEATIHATAHESRNSNDQSFLFVNEPVLTWHQRAYSLFGNFTFDGEALASSPVEDPQPRHLIYETLFGVPRRVLKETEAVWLEEEGPCDFRQWIDELRKWERLGRSRDPDKVVTTPLPPHGKDLFIKGMGSFEVEAAYNRLVDRRRRLHKQEVLLKTFYAFRELPKELEGVPSKALLGTSSYDCTFHLAMKLFLEKKLAQIERPTTCNGRRQLTSTTRQLLRQLRMGWLLGDPIWPRLVMSYWFVTIPHLCLEGYFPELLQRTYAAHFRHVDGNTTLREALVAESQMCPEYIDIDELVCPEEQICNMIALILMADGGKTFFDKDKLPQELRHHFIKYLCKWKEQMGSLEALCLFVGEEERMSSFVPEDVCLKWPSQGLSMTPQQLLKWIHHELQLIYSVDYSFLDDLPDTPSLKVLRSSYEVIQAGWALQNCAADYNESIEREKCVLVAYFDDIDKALMKGPTRRKPIALGMFELKEADKYDDKDSDLGGWSMIEMARLQDPTTKVLNAYKEYTATIHSWWRSNVTGAMT